MSADETKKETEAVEKLTEARVKSREELEKETTTLQQRVQAQQSLVQLLDNDAEETLKLIKLKGQLLEQELELAKARAADAAEIEKAKKALDTHNESSRLHVERLTMVTTLQKKGRIAAGEFGKALAGITPIIGGNADITN